MEIEWTWKGYGIERKRDSGSGKIEGVKEPKSQAEGNCGYKADLSK